MERERQGELGRACDVWRTASTLVRAPVPTSYRDTLGKQPGRDGSG